MATIKDDSNKSDMVPIGVIDMFITPIKQSIESNVRSIEKLSGNIDHLSEQIATKIECHDNDTDRRLDELRECLNLKDRENMNYFRTRAIEIDKRMNETQQSLTKLKDANIEFAEMAKDMKGILNSVNEHVKNMILVVTVAFGLFMVMYGLATFLAKSNIDHAVKQIVESRQQTNYWIDQNGIKHYYYMDKESSSYAPKQVPSK